MVGRTPAGWYPDPSGRPGYERFFDGSSWTDQERTVTVTFPPRPRTDTAAAQTAPATSAPAPGSLADLLDRQQPATSPAPSTGPAFDVAPDSAQALLAATATGWRLKRRPTRADPGWYYDPARTNKLRFYDGRGWTQRTRVPLNARRNQLPAAALALRAKMLELADAKAAASDAGHKWRNPKLVISAPQPVPTLHLAVRTRAGRVGGMLSMVTLIAGLTMAGFLGWQYWLSGIYEHHVQASMRQVLVHEFGHRLDHYSFRNPSPVRLQPAVAAAPGHTSPPSSRATRPSSQPGTPVHPHSPSHVVHHHAGRPHRPGPTLVGPAPQHNRPQHPASPGHTRRQHPRPPSTTSRPVHHQPPRQRPATPAAATRPARHRDIRPWPPAGWTPPSHRRVWSVKRYRLGAPIGRIIIPRMHLDQVMVAGTGDAQLAEGVGVGTWGVLPGTPGNAILAGHRTSHAAPFYNIDKLRYGDQIIIEIPGQGRSVYEVRGHAVVRPWQTALTRQTPGVRLTLTSCHPAGSTAFRYVVAAEMVSGDWLDYTINRHEWRMHR